MKNIFNESICDIMDAIQQITLILNENAEYRKNTTRFELFETARNWGVEFYEEYDGNSDFDKEIQLFINNKLEQLNYKSIEDVMLGDSSLAIGSKYTKKIRERISFNDNLKSDIKSEYHANQSISNKSNKLNDENIVKYLVAYIVDGKSLDNAVVRLSNTDKINSGTFRSKLLKLYPDAMYIRILSWSKIID